MTDQTSGNAAISSRAEAFESAEAAALEAFAAEYGAEDDSAPAEAAPEAQGDEDDQPETEQAVDHTNEEVETEQAGEDEPAEPEAFDPNKWDGRWETLPDEQRQILDPIHKTMERGLHKNFRELAEARKEAGRVRDEYARKLEELHKGPVAGQAEDNGPPLPTEADSPEEQARKCDAREAWRIQRAVAEQVKQAGAKDPQVQQLLAEREYARRVGLVQTMPGYSEDVGQAMAFIAKQHP